MILIDSLTVSDLKFFHKIEPTENSVYSSIKGVTEGSFRDLNCEKLVVKNGGNIYGDLYGNYKGKCNFSLGNITTLDYCHTANIMHLNLIHGSINCAEARKTTDIQKSRVVIEQDDGSLILATKRLQPGACVISNAPGIIFNETEENKTLIVIAGRVLVYPYQNREKYHAGMAVCSAPDGTVDIMTRLEVVMYPDCIIGTVSEIPSYDMWNNVKVDGRIWITI